MARLNRRVKNLEGRMLLPEGEARDVLVRELLSRLTDEELHWLAEPADEAAALVGCPDHPGHDCACIERELLALEASPELGEEMERRWRVLCERHPEIFAREVPP